MALTEYLDAGLRAGHLTAAVVWLGFIYFTVYVRPRVMAHLPPDVQRQLMPQMARYMLPWMITASTLTILFGALLYFRYGQAFGFENIGWALNLGVLLAFVMWVLGLSFVVPVMLKAAKVPDGGAPPLPAELVRLNRVGHVMAALSFVVLFLMIVPSRVGWT